ncbi:unnamed protein product, partial [Prorocentrum cordatum]
GDLNLAEKAPRLLDAVPCPDPTAAAHDLNTLNTIDHILISFPSWVCTQLFFSGKVTEYPEVLLGKGISDHAPLVIEIC